MNVNTDIITGTPKPPFLMIAPNGAPIKKNINMESALVIFFIHSIQCLRMILSPTYILVLFIANSLAWFCIFVRIPFLMSTCLLRLETT